MLACTPAIVAQAHMASAEAAPSKSSTCVKLKRSHPGIVYVANFYHHRYTMWRGLMNRPALRYSKTIDNTCSVAYGKWVAHLWHFRSHRAHGTYRRWVKAQAATGYPSWFKSDMVCISAHEEYGMNGPNTVAGYFGLIYPPSVYVDPGPTIASQYGDSWLDVPLSPQLALSYSLYQHYGWSPWSTAPGCNL
jgi:hypothetical protein